MYALKGKNGAYAIRDAETRAVLYVGESHSRRLFETMTRHLYTWNGFGSGPSYRAEAVEVAAHVLSADEAIVEQYEMIRRLRPVDNVRDGRSLFVTVNTDDDLSDVPF